MAVKDLDRLRTLGVPEINKAIDAFYEITASSPVLGAPNPFICTPMEVVDYE